MTWESSNPAIPSHALPSGQETPPLTLYVATVEPSPPVDVYPQAVHALAVPGSVLPGVSPSVPAGPPLSHAASFTRYSPLVKGLSPPQTASEDVPDIGGASTQNPHPEKVAGEVGHAPGPEPQTMRQVDAPGFEPETTPKAGAPGSEPGTMPAVHGPRFEPGTMSKVDAPGCEPVPMRKLDGRQDAGSKVRARGWAARFACWRGQS
jgi:hypothetical protein